MVHLIAKLENGKRYYYDGEGGWTTMMHVAQRYSTTTEASVVLHAMLDIVSSDSKLHIQRCHPSALH